MTREEIARVIDPDAFRAEPELQPTADMRQAVVQRRNHAGAKADVILALFSSPSLGGEGKQEDSSSGSDLSSASRSPTQSPAGLNHIGAAEAELGRYIYRRIEALMDATPGTPDSSELAYLAAIAAQVEEYGEEACDGNSLASFPPAAPDPQAQQDVGSAHYLCGFQQANMEARMVVHEVLGDSAESIAIQSELAACADRRAQQDVGER